MQSARIIKRRIKTTKNIKQITKAMEMVAASKMRRAQQQALRSKPYSNKLHESLTRLASSSQTFSHPLLESHEEGRSVVILVGPDKGLTGGMISNLLKEADLYMKQFGDIEMCDFITIGKKAREFALKMGFSIVAEFSNMSDKVAFEDILPITQLILDGYNKKTIKEVFIIYMDFVSTLIQNSKRNQLLPISLGKAAIASPGEVIDKNIESKFDYVFEPSPEEILDWILPYHIEVQVYQTMLEAKASEHSARMVAMKNAKDNAGEIIDDLTLEYNKSRQASITNELLDITTATYTS
jgi:F-type H+-transporting ATPase subunit gamma